ncbi:MAG: o-succinylbenzoate--CoA ligase [Candidatus Omnitrophica bacterium]|nr:o-succinylbenzoate--CoA ligase [Candidatus Omnitrophota bacterium]
MMTSIKCPLAEKANTHPQNPALIFQEQTLTYADYNKTVNQTVQFLKKQSIQKGDHVGILCDNHLNYVILIYALWRVGAVAVLLNKRLPEETALNHIQQYQCRFIFHNGQIRTDIPSAHLTSLIFDEADAPSEPKLFDPEQDATIMLTSGSSAQPKAALHSFGNHYYSALGSNEFIPFEQNDRWFLNLPLFHVGGLSIILRTILGGGCCVIAATDDDIFPLIENHGITHLSLVPTQLQRILSDKQTTPILKHCHCILVGGGPVWPSLKEEILRQQLPVRLTYGLTEMSSQVATTSILSEKPESHKARLLKYREIQMGKDNEIYVKGKTLFKGYLKGDSPQKGTAPKIISPFDSDGWFPTGDLGTWTAEGLTISGRKDNLFISGGENIQPEEIEAALLNIPGIRAAVVVPVKDPEFGQRPIAFVKTEAEGDSPLLGTVPDNLVRMMTETLAKTLPKYKIPVKFYPWPENQRSLKVNRQMFKM